MLPTVIILLFTVIIMFTVIPYAFISVMKQMEAAQVIEGGSRVECLMFSCCF